MNLSNGAVSDSFPAGLRVLVVDDDPCLMILEEMLRTCSYQVTTCSRGETALLLLRENTNGFDVVISNVHMPDMDGFKLLEHIGLEMDLPVIMMTIDDDKNILMKGVTHGACDYLIKPVRVEALKNIWQHVVRRIRYEWREEGDDTSTLQNPPVVWSVELHQQFVAAVDQLGIDKAVPKKVLELMNVPGLTRENVASHLQKYRLYLRRLRSVPQHQNNSSNIFETYFSNNRIDLQTAAAAGQLLAQSLPTLEVASNLRKSNQSIGNMNVQVNASGSQSNPLLMQMVQSQSQGLMLRENAGPPAYNPVPQKSSDWKINLGLTYDASQHSNPLQHNVDVSPSVFVHQGLSSAKLTGKDRDASLIGKTMFLWNKVIFKMPVNNSTPRSRMIQFSFSMLLVFCLLFLWSKPSFSPMLGKSETQSQLGMLIKDINEGPCRKLKLCINGPLQ